MEFTNYVEPSPLPDELINSSSLDSPEKGLGLYTDSTRFLIVDDDAGMGSDADVKEASLCGDWEDEDLQESMVKLALNEGDDLVDEDWLFYQLKKAKRLKTGQFLHCLHTMVKSHFIECREAKRVCTGSQCNEQIKVYTTLLS